MDMFSSTSMALDASVGALLYVGRGIAIAVFMSFSLVW
jgi:hypothetical protein